MRPSGLQRPFRAPQRGSSELGPRSSRTHAHHRETNGTLGIDICIYISIPKFPFVSTGLAYVLELLRPNSLGLAWALEMAARARSASLGLSKWPLEPARPRWGARNGRSSSLGPAGALEMAARARSEPHGRSKWLLEPARSRTAARNGCSRPRCRRGARNGCSSLPRSRSGVRNGCSSEPQGRSTWLLEPA